MAGRIRSASRDPSLSACQAGGRASIFLQLSMMHSDFTATVLFYSTFPFSRPGRYAHAADEGRRADTLQLATRPRPHPVCDTARQQSRRVDALPTPAAPGGPPGMPAVIEG